MMGVTRTPYLGGAFDARRYECPRLVPYGSGGGHHHPAAASATTLPPLLPPLDRGVLVWDVRGRPSPPPPASAAAASAAPTAVAAPTAATAASSRCGSPSRRASPEPPASAVTSAHASPLAGPSSPAACAAPTVTVAAAAAAAAPSSRPWSAAAAVAQPGRWAPSPASRSRGSGVRKPRAPKPKVAGQSRYWTPSEHRLFVEALSLYGTKDLKAIAAHVATRNQTQVRTHAQKWSMRLVREAKRACLGRADMQALVEAATVAAAAAAAASTGGAAGSSSSPVSRPTADAGRRPFCGGGGGEVRGGVPDSGGGEVDVDCIGSKCSVPAQCGMALLCLVGQDTMPAAAAVE
ncbi:hypothetical protein I4F81_002220 [Pyropia yezoensis]|uniref:Uncharacterized protein n=1 Tax=Pyropia yezoensis TaxID=2788 RepID=A0ACC3BQ74_PYRYE|nr:hypothetical protein I4F81_002220 [Neopyropia yezoensis]